MKRIRNEPPEHELGPLYSKEDIDEWLDASEATYPAMCPFCGERELIGQLIRFIYAFDDEDPGADHIALSEYVCERCDGNWFTEVDLPEPPPEFCDRCEVGDHEHCRGDECLCWITERHRA